MFRLAVPSSRPHSSWTRTLLAAALAVAASCVSGAESPGVMRFREKVKPLLVTYCYDCHGDGERKGNVAFDEQTTEAKLLNQPELWLAALKNVRAGLMPPEDNPRPTAEELKHLATWIKSDALGIDPQQPDPGRVALRRLNRVEYRNTVRDLMGADFNSEVEFPPDDTGNGFDNIADVLTVSPLLLEKYLQAAETMVENTVPKVSHVMRERVFTGRDFRAEGGGRSGGENLSVTKAASVKRMVTVDVTEHYRLVVDLDVRGSFNFDPGRAKVSFTVDGEPRFTAEVVWRDNKRLHYDYDESWTAGSHVLAFQLEPLAPVETPVVAPFNPGVPATAEPGVPASVRQQPISTQTRLDVRIASVKVQGPLPKKYWATPENYQRFFPNGPAPEAAKERDAYARDVLRAFATRAFRRPVGEAKLDQLTAIAQRVYRQQGKTFEEGIAQAMMGVLASPYFLFRLEPVAAGRATGAPVFVDDYALASRLSYFLWSTMPDEELFRLAAQGELRANLSAQVKRMLGDARSQSLVRNFTGQWLQARDVETVSINARAALGLSDPRRGGGGGPRVEFDAELRKAMRSETEMCFDAVMREDRSVLELLASDYTFLNERLATHYGIPGVTGEELRRVTLPADSPRGGVLTQGTMLTVTSNPTRTSPVKRGLFILENILGTPPPPPPPDVPALEEAKKDFKGREPTLREMLSVHRSNKLCASCHARMDPIGFALENFTALGTWRDTEARQPIDATGKLVTGETFSDVRELKRVLTHERRLDYYRCLTEKLFTYALGRGVGPRDLGTIDQIVDQLDQEHGRFGALLTGIIESPAFQMQRTSAKVAAVPFVVPSLASTTAP
ncbi:MAG: DUF1592 domain-containing protein [Opitutus sp.]|nr:DUF1592 domain-containing protein [Opitutus sp.]